MRRLLSIFTILTAVMLITSCQKELPDEIKNIDVSQGGMNPAPTATPASELKVSEPGQFGAKGGQQTITITATEAWTLTKSAKSDWLIVKTTSGKAGTIQVDLEATENTSLSERTATITVHSEAGTQTVKVIQSGAEAELQLNKNDLVFTSAEGNDSFTITSNTSWTITCNHDWCTLSSSSGTNNATVTVYVSENTSIDSRSATIIVKAGDLSKTIAVAQAGAKPVDESTKTFTVNGVSFKMIRVDGGTFTMGATSEQENDAYDDEKPTHQVTLSSYYIGETEVTQELWQAVMGSNPSYFCGAKMPVEQVTWDNCQEFIHTLNKLIGQSFRLPTEPEWEFAARGGNESYGYKYAGNNIIDNVAWYYENSNERTHEVATKAANELGLYDMSGNVWEWCQDLYCSYSSSSQPNPIGPSSSDNRVLRGGSWFDFAGICRVSNRDSGDPSLRNINLGLRLAL